MEDIDEKLKALKLEFLHGVPVTLSDPMIAQIKQALKDAGWTPPPTIHKVDYHKQ